MDTVLLKGAPYYRTKHGFMRICFSTDALVPGCSPAVYV
jgi:hypothetical protein